MSASPALLQTSTPVAPIPQRDAGAVDTETAQNAAALFEGALGEVDQRNSSSSGSADDTGDETGALADGAGDQGASSAQPSVQIGGGLVAALAAMGMPWATPISASTTTATTAAPEARPSDAMSDPLAALASALAANDAEPAVTSAPPDDAELDAYVDVEILGRERHLGVSETADTRAQRLDARLLTASADSADVDAATMVQKLQAPVAEALPAEPQATSAPVVAENSVQAKNVPVTAAETESAAQTMVRTAAGQTTTTVDSTRLDARKTADTEKADQQPVAQSRPIVTSKHETERGGAGLDGSGTDAGEANARAKTADTRTTERDFTSTLQSQSQTGPVSLAVQSDVTDGGVTTPASQVVQQLNSADAREVISAVRTDGDTRVIELKLQPQHLGTVTVRVTLKDDVISLKLEAEHAATVQEIGREAEKLAATLKQAGYVVDGITAQQIDPRSLSRIDAASNSSASGNSGQQGQAQGSAQGQANSGGSSNPGQNGQGRSAASAYESVSSGGNIDGQNNALASERQTGLYV